MGHLAVLFEEAEHGQNLPRPFVDLKPLPLVEDAGNIFVETAARDVADAVHVAVANHLQHLLHIDFRRREQHLAELFVRQFGIGLAQVQAVVRDDLAHEAEAVGVHAARRNAHQHVARPDLRTVDQLRLLHNAHRESGDVVFALGVHARHLGGLAAHQRTAGLTAAVGDTRDDGLDLLGFIAPHGHVVEEHQRFGALRQHVVDAHGHGINADRVVLVHLEGQLEFGSHAVGPAHEHRFLHLEGREVEHTAEGADVAHHTQTRGRGHMLFDAPHHFVSGFEIHAGLFITLSHSNIWFK